MRTSMCAVAVLQATPSAPLRTQVLPQFPLVTLGAAGDSIHVPRAQNSLASFLGLLEKFAAFARAIVFFRAHRHIFSLLRFSKHLLMLLGLEAALFHDVSRHFRTPHQTCT